MGVDGISIDPSSLAPALRELRAGRAVVLIDERTDSADLVATADAIEAATVNLMIREARGILAVALTYERCEALHLRRMTGIAETQRA